jgi:ATP-binding cassette subfamily B multidrug efflux pump
MSSNDYLHKDKTASFLDRRLWVRILSLAKDHKWLAIGSLALLVVAEFLPLFQPRILRSMIDGPIAERNLDGILYYLIIFGVVALSGGVLEYARALMTQKLGLEVIHKLRLQLFGKLKGFHMDFFNRTPVGRLMQRLGNDVDSLNAMFTEGLVELSGALLMIFYAIVFMFVLDWKLALATLVVLPGMLYATAVFRRVVRTSNVKIRGLMAEMNSRMQESLAGVNIVRIFGRAPLIEKRLDGANRETRDAWFQNVKYYAYYFPTLNSLTEISLVLLYFTGAFLFYGEYTTLGTLVAFSWYTGMFFRPLREISDKITSLQSALAAGERVFTLYDTHASLPEGTIKTLPSPFRLRFENVSFAYPGGPPVLNKVSFQINEGESVAVVGATGSGKSTLMALASKFYLPTSGRVVVGDHAVEDYEESALRGVMALIPQDVHLFSESIAFNVSLTPDFDVARVEEVCRQVRAHGFIERMPEGYSTVLRQRGENLSTGQRQLLALARALYQRPKLLLLDEATASVDTDTEGLIQEALGKVLKQVTTIVVAHRLSTIRNADRILVMHKGEIREEGNHQELLAKGGIYAKLYQLQNFEDEAG